MRNPHESEFDRASADDPWILVESLGVDPARPTALEEEAWDAPALEPQLPGTEFGIDGVRRRIRRRCLFLALLVSLCFLSAPVLVPLTLLVIVRIFSDPGSFFLGPLLAGGFLLLAGVGSVSILKSIGRTYRRYRRYRLAANADPSVPDPHNPDRMAVTWWGLLRGGFAIEEPPRDFRDDARRLIATPWRILRLGARRIPVFKAEDRADVGNRVSRHEYAQAAAYCTMTERIKGGESPYAVMLVGGTLKGIAIPAGQRERRTLSVVLREARIRMSDKADGALLRRAEASGADPWIQAYELSEFIFCNRAGVLAFEQERETESEPPKRSSWWERHHYTLLRMRRDLHKSFLLASSLLVGPGLLLWAVLQVVDPGAWLFLAGLAVAVLTGSSLCHFLPRSFEFWRKYRKARRAPAKAPDARHNVPTPIEWWSLRSAGFECVRPHESYRDLALRLAGRPWRILRRGSLRIPIYRRRQSGGRLYRQHYARIAAYCHLIEVSEGAQSPFGIVLFGNTHEGLTVPAVREHRDAFLKALIGARPVFLETRAAFPRESLCDNCPLGRERHGVGNELEASPCGERFEWSPPQPVYDDW